MNFLSRMRSKNKILQTVCFLGCFVLVAIATAYRNTAIPASAEAEQKQIIVLDAGHEGLQ